MIGGFGAGGNRGHLRFGPAKIAQHKRVFEKRGELVDFVAGKRLGRRIFGGTALRALEDGGAKRSEVGIVPQSEKGIGLTCFGGRRAAPDEIKRGARRQVCRLETRPGARDAATEQTEKQDLGGETRPASKIPTNLRSECMQMND